MKTNHWEKSKESITMETHDFSPEVHVLAGTLVPVASTNNWTLVPGA
jgi:hypothetical protein